MKNENKIASIAVIIGVFFIVCIIILFQKKSFFELVGDEWNTVKLEYFGDGYKEEMILTDEEIEKVYHIFSEVEVKLVGSIFQYHTKMTGDGADIWINGRGIWFYERQGTINFGLGKYQISGNDDYIQELNQLKEEFAEARGFKI